MRRQNIQAGFTLIETVIVIVLVGVMMAGMAALFISNVEHSHRPYLRQKSLAVANAYMEEIVRKRWDENTPIGGGCVNSGASCATGPAASGIGTEEASRPDFDDVDDYHGLNQSPPQDASGTNLPEFDGFTVTVAVTQGAWNGIASADVKQVTVSVTSPNTESIALTAYRVNY